MTNALADASKQPEASAQSSIPADTSANLPAIPASVLSLSSLPRPKAAPIIHIPPAEDPLLHLFTSMVMRHGKRQAASSAVAKMLVHIHAFTKAPPLPILRQAVFMAAPLLRCRSFKRAAKQYVFPMPLSERQRAWHAVDWILEASKMRGGRTVSERAAREIVAIIKGDKSDAMKNKENVHKLAVLHRGNVVRPPSVPRSNRA